MSFSCPNDFPRPVAVVCCGYLIYIKQVAKWVQGVKFLAASGNNKYHEWSFGLCKHTLTFHTVEGGCGGG